MLSAEEQSRAIESGRQLTRLLSRPDGLLVHVSGAEGPSEVLDIPAPVLRVLADLLETLAHGQAVTWNPSDAEYTTQQAADFLNVSRPYLIKLLESGAIPFRKVGTHRRVSIRELASYKTRDHAERARVLDELVAEAQDLEMGY